MTQPAKSGKSATPGGSLLLGASAFVAGLLVPGLGHALLRRWARAGVFLISVVTLAAAGVWMRGHIYDGHAADAFEWLGYLADLGTGLLYPAAKHLNIIPDISRAAGDYGTRFFAAAGAMNLLCAFDAYAIGTGRKG
jgi:uncharacterized protein DUF6677